MGEVGTKPFCSDSIQITETNHLSSSNSVDGGPKRKRKRRVTRRGKKRSRDGKRRFLRNTREPEEDESIKSSTAMDLEDTAIDFQKGDGLVSTEREVTARETKSTYLIDRGLTTTTTTMQRDSRREDDGNSPAPDYYSNSQSVSATFGSGESLSGNTHTQPDAAGRIVPPTVSKRWRTFRDKLFQRQSDRKTSAKDGKLISRDRSKKLEYRAQRKKKSAFQTNSNTTLLGNFRSFAEHGHQDDDIQIIEHLCTEKPTSLNDIIIIENPTKIKSSPPSSSPGRGTKSKNKEGEGTHANDTIRKEETEKGEREDDQEQNKKITRKIMTEDNSIGSNPVEHNKNVCDNEMGIFDELCVYGEECMTQEICPFVHIPSSMYHGASHDQKEEKEKHIDKE